MAAEKKREPGFEQDLEKLEAIVSALEEGGLPLEEALKQFETGIGLTRKCEKTLREAERKIEMLVRTMDGDLEAQPFEEGSEGTAGQTERERAAAKPAPRRQAPPAAPPPEEYIPEPPEEDMEELF